MQFIAFNRNKYPNKSFDGMQINWLTDFHFDISSTEIRKQIAAGNLPNKELTLDVLKYIQSNYLYNYSI